MASSKPRTVMPLLLAACFLAGCGGESPSEEQVPIRPVKTVIASAEVGTLESLPGIVLPRVETVMAFRVMGRLLDRKVVVGDLVKRDQLLATVDPVSLRLALNKSAAVLRDAEARYADAAQNLRRKRALVEARTGSVADSDMAEQQVEAAKADVTSASAMVAKAREQLGYADLRSEYDGIVTGTFVEPGQVVSAGQPVIRIAQPRLLDVVADVPESTANVAKKGDHFVVALQIAPDRKIEGIVREVAPQADPATRTFRVKICINEAPDQFRIGAMVSVRPVLNKPHRPVTIPSSAVTERGGEFTVWVVDRASGSVRSREVKLAPAKSGESFAQVMSGLAEGDEVVVAGTDHLTNGQKVNGGTEQHK